MIYKTLLLALLFNQGTAASPSFFRPSPRIVTKQQNHKFSSSQHSLHDSFPSKVIAIQGGEEVSDESEDAALGLVLNLGALVAAINGIGLGLFPQLASNLLLGFEVEEDSLDEYCLTAVGCFILDVGITGYLAASGLTTVEEAIGYGLLPDVFFMGKDIVDGTFQKFHVKTGMSVAFAVVAVGAYTLIRNIPNAMIFAKVVSILPLAKDLYVYINPVGAAKKMLDEDLSENNKTKALYRANGQYQVISSFLKGLLAFGVEPVKAVGYSCVFHIMSLVDTAFIRKKHKDLGNSCVSSVVYMVILAATGIVCLRE